MQMNQDFLRTLRDESIHGAVEGRLGEFHMGMLDQPGRTRFAEASGQFGQRRIGGGASRSVIDDEQSGSRRLFGVYGYQ